MNKTKIMALGILFCSLAIGLASLLLPTPIGSTWVTFNLNFAISLTMATLFVGSAVLFVQGLRGFTETLKRSYRFICTGIALLGVAQIQLPITVFLGAQDSFVGLSIIPVIYAVAIVTIFTGVRSFAMLFEVRGRATSWKFGLAVFAVLAILVTVAPHAHINGPEYKFDGGSVLGSFMIVLMLMVGQQLLAVKKVASAVYSSALAWMFLGLMLIAAMGIVHLCFTLAVGDAHWYTYYVTSSLVPSVFALSGLCILRAAYSFNLIAAAVDTLPATTPRNFFGKSLQSKVLPQMFSSVDIITYVAHLASDYRAVDPLLDPMRQITARLTPGTPLTSQDEDALLRVYTQLEQYLLTQEKLRAFTKDSLRQNIVNALKLGAGQSTFWGRLT